MTKSSQSSSSEVPEVFSITGARVGITEDQSARQRRYLIGMSLRTASFIGAVLTEGTIRWILVAGAVFLPYFAVVIANAGRERMLVEPVQAVTPLNYRAIGQQPTQSE